MTPMIPNNKAQKDPTMSAHIPSAQSELTAAKMELHRGHDPSAPADSYIRVTAANAPKPPQAIAPEATAVGGARCIAKWRKSD